MAHQFPFNSFILGGLPAPATGFDVVQDLVDPRLRLYITSRGVKTFFTRKRVNGKDKRIIIGKYPDMEIDEARAMVDSVLETVSKPPRTRRVKIKFQKIIELYMTRKVRRNEVSRAKLVRSVTNHLTSLFEKNIQDISRHDIGAVLESINGAAARNRMHELLSSVFNFAIESGYVSENPVVNIPKVAEVRRVRPLNKTGLERLVHVMNKEKDPTLRAAFLMLVYGFAPKSKIFSMRWRDLDFNQYTWCDVPLSDAAVVLLMNLPQNGKWVFPGFRGGHLTDPRGAWHQIAADARIPNLTMDDVYKFMRSRLVWAGDREIFRFNMNTLIDTILS